MDPMEERVRFLRHLIVQFVRDARLSTYLISTGVLNQVESTAIQRLYQTDPSKATEKLVDALLESPEPGRWQALIDSLKNAEYPYLAKLLENDQNPQEHVREIRIIELFGPFLQDKINPGEIVNHLQSFSVINESDKQQVLARIDSHGSIAATTVLLDCIKHRLPPNEWYPKFLQALIDSGSRSIVEQIDPDFFQGSGYGSSSYCPPTKKSLQGSLSSSSTDSGPSSVREDFSEAWGGGEASMDCLGTPLPPSPDTVNVLSPHSQGDLTKPGGEKSAMGPAAVASRQSNGSNLLDSSLTNVKRIVGGENWNQPSEKTSDKKELNIAVGEPEPTALPSTTVPKEIDRQEEDSSSDSDNLDSDYDDDKGSSEFTLRSDQMELTEKAVQGQNTIICAETGTGKTFVAFHIVKKHMEKREGTGKVVFMARTGALIQQQYERFCKYLPNLQVLKLTGDHDTSLMLKALLPSADVFCMTPQILLNNLERDDTMSLDLFSLLVLDECHHATKDEPYNRLMRRYLMEKYEGPKKENLPQVVGLTASLGVGKSRTDLETMDHILGVCANLDVLDISTVEREREEAAKHISKPTEENIQMKHRIIDPGRDLLLLAIRETELKLEDFVMIEAGLLDEWNKLPRDKMAQQYFKWIVDFEKLARSTVDDTGQSRDILACTKHLSVYCSALEVNDLLRLADVTKFLANRFKHEGMHKDRLNETEKDLLDYFKEVQKKLMKQSKTEENPNVKLLTDLLKQLFDEKGAESRAMVFLKARATCKALASALQEEFRGIGVGVSPLYGKDKRGDEEGMTDAEQQDAVEKFREGHHKILVATSIGQEGIDIPDCNIILSYNYAGNEITKIQMSGRIRKTAGGAKINLAKEKIILQEVINLYKVNMMYCAMEMIKKLDHRNKHRKIQLMQKAALETEKMRRMSLRSLMSPKSNAGRFDLQCWRCKTHACYNSDIRVLHNSNHFVIDQSFADRINTKPHKSPKKIDGLEKKSKMYCKRCPLDWGVVFEHKGMPVRTLKLENFAVVDLDLRTVRHYKKWHQVPFRPDEVSIDDLSTLGNEN